MQRGERLLRIDAVRRVLTGLRSLPDRWRATARRRRRRPHRRAPRAVRALPTATPRARRPGPRGPRRAGAGASGHPPAGCLRPTGPGVRRGVEGAGGGPGPTAARRHDAVRVIEAKTDGRELDDDEVDW